MMIEKKAIRTDTLRIDNLEIKNVEVDGGIDAKITL